MNYLSSTLKLSLCLSLLWLAVLLPTPWAEASELCGSMQAGTRVPDGARQLWTASLGPIFKRPVTTSEGAYYAGELLMVPLHAAFSRNDPEWEKEFSDYFQSSLRSLDQVTDVELSRLQFLYLSSQFLVLAKNSGHADLIPSDLPDLLLTQIRAIWQEKPAWMWDRPAFTGGMRIRILWKLNNRKVAKSYYRAILDEDFFLFSIAADLKNYGGSAAQRQEWQPTLDDVLSVAYAVFSREVVRTQGGGWVMQPGVWTDHPDYKYAGNTQTRPEMQPASAVPGIGWDSSHFMRCPLWLWSLELAYPAGDPKRQFYADLQQGLNKQFLTKVLVPPTSNSPCYRLNNFMDGSNGVYRWNYASLGPNNGYGPYGVSGALVLGWWAFLGTEQSRQLYRALAKQYPWPKECIELYLGPNRERRWTDSQLSPESSGSQLRYLLVLLASEL